MKRDRNLSLETARIIASAIVKVQRKIADRLQKLDELCSIPQKKIGLFLFMLICGGYLLMVLGHALFDSRREKHTIEIPQGKPPFVPPLINSQRDTLKNNIK